MSPSTPPRRVQPQILLVDDHIDVLDAWALLLEAEGFEVATASSALEALRQTIAEPPDLVVTDLMMPVMDGLALCRRLRADPRLSTIPIILWTAANVRISEPVFDVFLNKPVSIDDMLGHIERLLVARTAGYG